MKPASIMQSSARFKLFHDLMAWKVRRILLISTSYEAWIMEEDCRLSEQIINEYSGLNLSQPPRLTWVSSVEDAVAHMAGTQFDFVIAIASSVDATAHRVVQELKQEDPQIPVVLLTHQETLPQLQSGADDIMALVDHIFFWTGQADILLAIIKCVEDYFNVKNDVACADVRVILFVEDSPFYLSSMLPVLYKELVSETQAVIDDGLNAEHRLLMMRARPKILVAHSYEQAMQDYEQFKPNILGVITDVRFPRGRTLDGRAGVDLLTLIKEERFDIPLLLASSEPHNKRLAGEIPALFVDKNSSHLHSEIRQFLKNHLGFGSFVFRAPDGSEVDKAADLYELEMKLAHIPLDCFLHHCRKNDFSRWFYSLAEVELAAYTRSLRDEEFESSEAHRQYLLARIRGQRMQRQKGVLVNFDRNRFNPDTEFVKIGKGSLGGKARGLAFFSAMLHQHDDMFGGFPDVEISVPRTLVLTTECFDAFMDYNRLDDLVKEDLPDDVIGDFFSCASFPRSFRSDLESYLKRVDYPLAVRSSSLLEDAQFKSYAGLYHTYIVPNDHQELRCRLSQLLLAIKMVYASTYFRAPRSFAKRVGNSIENEKMAVVIQRAVGSRYGDSYYPAVSGVAQSLNYYPFSPVKTDDGIANIGVGLGKVVMEGENTLRFSPRHPEVLPQHSLINDLLKNAQRHFYAVKMDDTSCCREINDQSTLLKRTVSSGGDEAPVCLLSSTYDPVEHRIRDVYSQSGHKVLTFSALLKHRIIPFPKIVETLLTLGREKLGCPVEIEFALDLAGQPDEPMQFSVLQIRPMSAREEMIDVEISNDDMKAAFCVSGNGLGNTVNREMSDIVYVKPDAFNPAETRRIASEISQVNATLLGEGCRYILIGPGRWGSADHWLGIPVTWVDISGVGGIVETVHEKIQAEPSQGSHFFHNITTLGINYLHVDGNPLDRFDWQWLKEMEVIQQTDFIAHVRSKSPLTLKVDGRSRNAVIIGGR
ncbi:MAG: PEP/pyruvate-binding domain-containing protein [Desulforhopalus sp.]